MNFKNITVGIVTFKSEKVIYDCLNSIRYIKKIIIFDNSNDLKTTKKIETKFPNIQIINSKVNLGYGCANNKIIQKCKTKYLFILNPDTILKKNCEKELLKSLKVLKDDFSIISPLCNDKNYGFFDNRHKKLTKKIMNVEYVKGFAMLVNIRKIKKIGLFDKNIFLYLEEIDLCKRLNLLKEKILICKKAKVKHLSARSSNLGFEFEKCRNWHWMWSNFYYDKKHKGLINAYKNSIPRVILDFFKLIVYFVFNYKKSIIYRYRLMGSIFAMLGLPSSYRPKI